MHTPAAPPPSQSWPASAALVLLAAAFVAVTAAADTPSPADALATIVLRVNGETLVAPGMQLSERWFYLLTGRGEQAVRVDFEGAVPGERVWAGLSAGRCTAVESGMLVTDLAAADGAVSVLWSVPDAILANTSVWAVCWGLSASGSPSPATAQETSASVAVLPAPAFPASLAFAYASSAAPQAGFDAAAPAHAATAHRVSLADATPAAAAALNVSLAEVEYHVYVAVSTAGCSGRAGVGSAVHRAGDAAYSFDLWLLLRTGVVEGANGVVTTVVSPLASYVLCLAVAAAGRPSGLQASEYAAVASLHPATVTVPSTVHPVLTSSTSLFLGPGAMHTLPYAVFAPGAAAAPNATAFALFASQACSGAPVLSSDDAAAAGAPSVSFANSSVAYGGFATLAAVVAQKVAGTSAVDALFLCFRLDDGSGGASSDVPFRLATTLPLYDILGLHAYLDTPSPEARRSATETTYSAAAGVLLVRAQEPYSFDLSFTDSPYMRSRSGFDATAESVYASVVALPAGAAAADACVGVDAAPRALATSVFTSLLRVEFAGVAAAAAGVRQVLCVRTAAGGAAPVLEVHAVQVAAKAGSVVYGVAGVATAVPALAEAAGHSYSVCGGGGGDSGPSLSADGAGVWWLTAHVAEAAALCVSTDVTAALPLNISVAAVSLSLLLDMGAVRVAFASTAGATLYAGTDGAVSYQTFFYADVGAAGRTIEVAVCGAQGAGAAALTSALSQDARSGGVRRYSVPSLQLAAVAGPAAFLCVRGVGGGAWFGTALRFVPWYAFAAFGRDHPVLPVTPTLARDVAVSVAIVAAAAAGSVAAPATPAQLFLRRRSRGCAVALDDAADAMDEVAFGALREGSASLLLRRYYAEGTLLCLAAGNATVAEVAAVTVAVSGVISVAGSPPPVAVAVMVDRENLLPALYVSPTAAAEAAGAGSSGPLLFLAKAGSSCAFADALPGASVSFADGRISVRVANGTDGGGEYADGQQVTLCAGNGTHSADTRVSVALRRRSVFSEGDAAVPVVAWGDQRVRFFAAAAAGAAQASAVKAARVLFLRGGFACPPPALDAAEVAAAALVVDAATGEAALSGAAVAGTADGGAICMALSAPPAAAADAAAVAAHFHLAVGTWQGVRFTLHGSPFGEEVFVAEAEAEAAAPHALALAPVSGAPPPALHLAASCAGVDAASAGADAEVDAESLRVAVPAAAASSGLVFCAVLAGSSSQQRRVVSTGMVLRVVRARARHVSLEPLRAGIEGLGSVGLLDGTAYIGLELAAVGPTGASAGTAVPVTGEYYVAFVAAAECPPLSSAAWLRARVATSVDDAVAASGGAPWVVPNALSVPDAAHRLCLQVRNRAGSGVGGATAGGPSAGQSVTQLSLRTVGDAAAGRPLLPLLHGVEVGLETSSTSSSSSSSSSSSPSIAYGYRRLADAACAPLNATVSRAGAVTLTYAAEIAPAQDPHFLCVRPPGAAADEGYTTTEVRLAAVRVGLGRAEASSDASSVGVRRSQATTLLLAQEGVDVSAGGRAPLLRYSLQPEAARCDGALEGAAARPAAASACGQLVLGGAQTAAEGRFTLCASARLAGGLTSDDFYDVGLRIVVTEPTRVVFVTQPRGLRGDGTFTGQPRLALVDPSGAAVSVSALSGGVAVRAWWEPRPPVRPTALWTSEGVRAAALSASGNETASEDAIDFADVDTSQQVLLAGVFGVSYRLHAALTAGGGGVFSEAVSVSLERTTCLDAQQVAPLGGTECVPCPEGTVCNGTVHVRALDGWWRSGNLSLTFYRCPFPAACRDAVDGRVCAEGYGGVMCATCAEGYGTASNACVECGPAWQGASVVAAMGLGVVLWVCILVFSTLSASQNILSPVPLMMKITINHLVVSSRLPEIIASSPSSLLDTFRSQKTVGTMGFDSVAASDCVLRLSVHELFLAWMCVPFAILALAWATPAVIACVRHLRSRGGAEVGAVAADIDDDKESDEGQAEILERPVLFLKVQFVKVRGGIAADAVSAARLRLRRGRQELDLSEALIENPLGRSPAQHGCANLTVGPVSAAAAAGKASPLAYTFPVEEDNASQTLSGGGTDASSSQSGAHADLDWIDYNKKPLVIRLPCKQNVTGFSFVTSSGPIDRDPIRWAVYWSPDGKAWERANSQFTDFDVPEARNRSLPWFVLQPPREGHLNVYVVCVVVLLHFAYPYIIEQAARMVSCERIDLATLAAVSLGGARFVLDGKEVPRAEIELDEVSGTYFTYRFARDLSTSCSADAHRVYVMVAKALLAVYGLGLPLGIALVVVLVRRMKGKRNAFTLFHFLVSGLGKRTWFWEMLIMIRKMMILVFINFIEAPLLRTYFCMWVMTGFFIATLAVQPMTKKMKGRPDLLEQGSLAVLSLTINLAVLYTHLDELAAPTDTTQCPSFDNEVECETHARGACEWALPELNATEAAAAAVSDGDDAGYTCARAGGGFKILQTWAAYKQLCFYALTTALIVLNVGYMILLLCRLIPAFLAEYSQKAKSVVRKHPWIVPRCCASRAADWARDEEDRARRRSTRLRSVAAAHVDHLRRRSTAGGGVGGFARRRRSTVNPMLPPSLQQQGHGVGAEAAPEGWQSDTDTDTDGDSGDEGGGGGGEGMDPAEVDEWSSDSDDPQHDTRAQEVEVLRSEARRLEDDAATQRRLLQQVRQERARLREQRDELRAQLSRERTAHGLQTAVLRQRQAEADARTEAALRAGEEASPALQKARRAEEEAAAERRLRGRLAAEVRAAEAAFGAAVAGVLGETRCLEALAAVFRVYGETKGEGGEVDGVEEEEEGPALNTSWGFWCFLADAQLSAYHKAAAGTLRSHGVPPGGGGRVRLPALVAVLRDVLTHKGSGTAEALALPIFLQNVAAAAASAAARGAEACLLSVGGRNELAARLRLADEEHAVFARLFRAAGGGGDACFVTLRGFHAAVEAAGLGITGEVRAIYGKAVRATVVLLPHQFVEALLCVFRTQCVHPWLGHADLADEFVAAAEKATAGR